MQSLDQLLKETDALTYINSLKVTLVEIKEEISQQEELREHLNNSSERTKKLLRKADNQYRLIAKIVQSADSSVANNVTINDDMDADETLESLKELMESE